MNKQNTHDRLSKIQNICLMLKILIIFIVEVLFCYRKVHLCLVQIFLSNLLSLFPYLKLLGLHFHRMLKHFSVKFRNGLHSPSISWWTKRDQSVQKTTCMTSKETPQKFPPEEICFTRTEKRLKGLTFLVKFKYRKLHNVWWIPEFVNLVHHPLHWASSTINCCWDCFPLSILFPETYICLHSTYRWGCI